jgi:hypothetical protein
MKLRPTERSDQAIDSDVVAGLLFGLTNGSVGGRFQRLDCATNGSPLTRVRLTPKQQPTPVVLNKDRDGWQKDRTITDTRTDLLQVARAAST